MTKVIVDGFELSQEYIERLLHELKDEGIKSAKDLEHYLKDYWHTEDTGLKSHLLLCKHPKKRNFALPFDDD